MFESYKPVNVPGGAIVVPVPLRSSLPDNLLSGGSGPLAPDHKYYACAQDKMAAVTTNPRT